MHVSFFSSVIEHRKVRMEKHISSGGLWIFWWQSCWIPRLCTRHSNLVIENHHFREEYIFNRSLFHCHLSFPEISGPGSCFLCWYSKVDEFLSNTCHHALNLGKFNWGSGVQKKQKIATSFQTFYQLKLHHPKINGWFTLKRLEKEKHRPKSSIVGFKMLVLGGGGVLHPSVRSVFVQHLLNHTPNFFNAQKMFRLLVKGDNLFIDLSGFFHRQLRSKFLTRNSWLTWGIIPFNKWLITMVIVVVP